ncbi:hypothetical protein CCO03_08610 [Comamonas serinivorans]|uniref:Exonuclease domain-containing protein n=1 Tax=Comamonas serinivorans TaxID=1082851 RepID=A0A1Y0EMT8_9BURK|nr:3'-5' exonuclease [Comamonas serinivorans]ARU04728.1 hypothetical protein CCO03_08610 [Comamonas serinivorans]
MLIVIVALITLAVLCIYIKNKNNNPNKGQISNASAKDVGIGKSISELSDGFKVVKIKKSELAKASDEQCQSIRKIDDLLHKINVLYSQEFDTLSQEQKHDTGMQLVGFCDSLLWILNENYWFDFDSDFDVGDAKDTAWKLWMQNLPKYYPDDGCTLVAIVDTETTGLQSHDEPITCAILLAEIRMPKGSLVRVVDKYYGKREPNVVISEGAQLVHGLTFEDVRGHVFDSLHMEKMLRSAGIVVAHNAKFDRRMLRHALLDSDGLPWACSMLTLRNRWDERVGKRSLDAICLAMGVERPTPHNALTDCESLLKALCLPSGKTARSKSFMALLLARPWCPDGD